MSGAVEWEHLQEYVETTVPAASLRTGDIAQRAGQWWRIVSVTRVRDELGPVYPARVAVEWSNEDLDERSQKTMTEPLAWTPHTVRRLRGPDRATRVVPVSDTWPD